MELADRFCQQLCLMPSMPRLYEASPCSNSLMDVFTKETER